MDADNQSPNLYYIFRPKTIKYTYPAFHPSCPKTRQYRRRKDNEYCVFIIALSVSLRPVP